MLHKAAGSTRKWILCHQGAKGTMPFGRSGPLDKSFGLDYAT